jgi:tRNA U34 5-methylaminomethyl-2-thiouridine-forming methyltransferase MnmC
MSDLEIITTSDGSFSLLNTQLQETYHSVHGALQESNHVFIGNGFDYFVETNPGKAIRVLDVGIGTGLNALLTLEAAQERHVDVHYTTLETSPLPSSIWSQLNYGTSNVLQKHFCGLHEAPWDKEEKLALHFTLLKINKPVQDVVFGSFFDLVYYDAFAPSKQPAMWEFAVLKNVADRISKGGVFVTYCAKGQLKRDLRSLGMTVETLSGPPGKKEMVRGLRG